jgi:anti-anti-sigma regulatory factor
MTAPGTCGSVTIPDLLREVKGCLRRQWGPVLIIDLSGVRELEMTVPRVLLWARRYCTSRGRDLHLVGPATGVIAAHDAHVVQALLRFHRDLAGARRDAEDSVPRVPAQRLPGRPVTRRHPEPA